MTTKTPAELRTQADECRRKADIASSVSWHASDYAPGSFVTGRSGRSRAMNKRSDRALDKTIDYAIKAVEYRKQAERCEAQARYIENEPARERSRELAELAERKARAIEKALPIINDPAICTLSMTSAEYTKIGRDFRGLIDVNGTHRVRSAMRYGALHFVYLTDKKTVTAANTAIG